MQPLIVLGSGAMAREVYGWAYQSGFQVFAFYDPEIKDEEAAVGKIPIVRSLVPYSGSEFVCGGGSPEISNRDATEAISKGLVFSKPIIHQTVIVGGMCQVVNGAVLAPRVTLTDSVRVEAGAFVGVGTVLESSVHVDRFATLGPGCCVRMNSHIGKNVTIGANCTISAGSKIEDGATILSGSVVMGVVPAGFIVSGNPARHRKLETVSLGNG